MWRSARFSEMSGGKTLRRCTVRCQKLLRSACRYGGRSGVAGFSRNHRDFHSGPSRDTAVISLCTRAMSDELKAPFKAQAQFENDQYKDKMARWNSGKCIGGTGVKWSLGARHAMMVVVMVMISLWGSVRCPVMPCTLMGIRCVALSCSAHTRANREWRHGGGGRRGRGRRGHACDRG